MIETEPPIAIIRAIPEWNAVMRRHMAMLEAGSIEVIAFALNGKPRHEISHLYLLVAGQVYGRMPIVQYDPGEPLKCWDGKTRKPGVWCVVTHPVERPPTEIKMRGFRGFRYLSTPLW